MDRTFIAFILSVSLLVAIGHADEPIFTGCPQSLQGSHCDSIFFQVSAINPKSNGANRNIRYHLVSGPGEIDEKTGLWIFHPELLDTFQRWPYEVEIAASLGKDTTTSETNCRFGVHIINQYPVWSLDRGAHVVVRPGSTMEIPISALEFDPCDELTVSIDRVIPELNGSIDYDPAVGLLTFTPLASDADTTFEVTLVANDGHNSSYWQISFHTYMPDPVVLKLSGIRGAEVGDTVSVDLMVTESPIGLARFDLLLDYDESRLRFLRAEEGEPFFSETDGCNWDRLYTRLVNACEDSDAGLLLYMSARADDYRPPGPDCYLPDSLPARLATLVLVVEGDVPLLREESQLNFYWCRCEDNTSLDETGRVAIFTRAVFNHKGRLFRPQPLPGYAGTSLDCLLESSLANERCQQMELHNGVVEILPDMTEAPIAVRVERQDGDGLGIIQGQETTVDILLDRSAHELGGFDLMVWYPVSAISCMYVEPGAFLEECEWEYFEYRFGADAGCPGGCPDGVVRIVAIAETNNGSHEPSCYIPDTFPAPVATIHFLVSCDQTLAGSFQPIMFYWSDCGNNAMSDKTGSELFISRHVFGPSGRLIPQETLFPTNGGAIPSCDSAGAGSVVRAIDFYSGGILIMDDSSGLVGDINLNGIAYEVMDVMAYANYFVFGPEYFLGVLDRVTAAADINYDGVPLTVEDLVLMAKIVGGNAVPGPLLNPPVEIDICPIYSNTSELLINTGECISALQVVIDGNAEDVTVPDGVHMDYAYDGTVTRVFMLWSFIEHLADSCLPTDGGVFLTYSGSGRIKEIRGSTYKCEPLGFYVNCPTDVDNEGERLPVEYSLAQNYPNPFNPYTAIQFALPQASHVDMVVYNVVGREVIRLVDGQMSAGYHTIQWDGRDNSGQAVASGIYLYKLVAGDFVQTKKMMLLK